AVASGIRDILIVTGRNKQSLEDHFDRAFELESILEAKENLDLLETVRRSTNMARIYFIRQQEARGLGHAVLCGREFAGGEPVAVLLGDDLIVSGKPCLKQMIDEK